MTDPTPATPARHSDQCVAIGGGHDVCVCYCHHTVAIDPAQFGYQWRDDEMVSDHHYRHGGRCCGHLRSQHRSEMAGAHAAYLAALDPTPATPDEAMAALAEARHAMVHVHQPPGWCESAVTRAMCEGYARQEHGHLAAAGWTLSRQQATPDEAVAALRSIFGHAKACRELMPTDGRCNCMDILAAAGWSLSRQQGDAVAALLDRVRATRKPEPGPGFRWRPGEADRLDGWNLAVDSIERWLLGIGADGAGDGR